VTASAQLQTRQDEKRAEAWIAQLERSGQTRHAQSFRVPTSAIIDVSRPQPTRTHSALSLFANIVLAILLALAFPLVLTAIGLPLVWLIRAAAGLVNLV